jgi:DNA-3-methyladenine glycosylase II
MVVAVLPSPESLVPLDETTLAAGVAVLADRDADLAGIVARLGLPPLWGRPASFETLVAIVLEQQVSLRSGAAALERLRLAAGSVDPAAILRLGDDGARAAGLTRQKARYVVGIAQASAGGHLDLEDLRDEPDGDVRCALTALVGVGRWTADIYLLMALRRPDIWPTGDLALAAAMRRLRRLDRLPTAVEQDEIAEGWRPYRAVGARILWHAYLAGER